ncbi:hypothetical protein CF134_21615 [Aeromonas salmonicida]|uniref:tetratricopeptide repeat protein n=1 Tax=Aeromonas salmonicida TaxID=645 RepID=UPI003BAFE3A6|nr:hypothetical protein CF134_21615 [Aeromonas salmonicida]
MYYYGIGVPQDYKQAITWFHKAAEQGIAIAQYSLGIVTVHREDVDNNSSGSG